MRESREFFIKESELHAIVKDFDEVLGGRKALPEEKGLNVIASECEHGDGQYVDISFPRFGGKFGDLWDRYRAGKINHKKAKSRHKYLTTDMTNQEKERGISLIMILKAENLLCNTDDVEFVLHNDEICDDKWLIENGPRITIRIPKSHINEDGLSAKSAQRRTLEGAGNVIRDVAMANGVSPDNIRGYSVEGITFDNPGYVAGLSCTLSSETDAGIQEMRSIFKNIGISLESIFSEMDSDEAGVFILRLEDPYDKDLMNKLENILNDVNRK